MSWLQGFVLKEASVGLLKRLEKESGYKWRKREEISWFKSGFYSIEEGEGEGAVKMELF